MKKLKIFSMILVVIMTLSGCFWGKGPNNQTDYPDYPLANKDSDSWLQIDPDDEDVEIDWYIDSSSYYISPSMTDKIYQTTGVKINWIKPVTDDGTKLGTYLANNTLPDVITVNDYAVRVQLAEEGYCWPLDGLAERWAPTMLDRIDQNLFDYYKSSDGQLYCLPANGYKDSDIAEFNDMGGYLISNGAIIVRKDYLEAYLEYKSSQNPSFNPDTYVTTKQGFIEMCQWVQNRYNLPLYTNPTVALAPFTAQGSLAISQLAEYFCVPPEDSEGNLIYQPAHAKYKEVLLFLNELYTKGLITQGNLSATPAAIGGYIQNGYVFAFIGSPQDFATYIKTVNIQKNVEYVPIVVTNDAKEAPLLTNLAGYGNRFTMITKNCKRIDRVIKVFDWLLSEQGHVSLYYGQEGVTFEYLIRPGETREITVNGETKTHTYTYGQIEFTDYAWEYIQSGRQTVLGLRATSLLWNPMYVRLTSVRGDELDIYQYYLQYNSKAALTPYTYDKRGLKFVLDPNHRDYNEMVEIEADLINLWANKIPQIIIAPNAQKATEIYNSTLNTAKVYGYEDLLEFQNECFQKHKQKMGITYAWPKNLSTYQAPAVKLLGYPEYNKEVPANIVRR
ncbi:MAG TPA: hypothetical protein VIL24_00595 [Clostridia bacterium]